jgi:hypothetical protein
MAVALSAVGVPAFQRFFGELPPLPIAVVLILSGVATMGCLSKAGALHVHRPPDSGALRLLAIAALFPTPVIVVDILGGFPEDLNAPWPGALLFYPVMALLAESAFHVLPLGGAYVVGVNVLRRHPRRAAALAVVLIALIEPVFQTMIGAGGSPWWANAYVALHVFLFNLLGLHALRRHGFVTAYLFRVTYYLVWHVAWGMVRLPILFAEGG